MILINRRFAPGLMLFSIVYAGCAAHTGPRTESTAYPPTSPPRTTPQPRIEVQHTVEPVPPMSAIDRAIVSSAYAKRGKPAVAIVFFDAANAIKLAPAVAPVTQTNISVSSSATTSITSGSANAAASIDGQTFTTTQTTVVGTASPHQLISWSDVQQACFDTLRGYGMKMMDPEMVTLNALDRLLVRTGQGVSLHTAELEQVRNALNFDVLFVIQEIGAGSDSYLQGRVWDLRDGALLAAQRNRLLFGRVSETAKILVQNSARRLAVDLLRQTVESWSNS